MSVSETREAAGRRQLWPPVILLGLAALGWWWSAVSAGDMAAMDTASEPAMPMPTMPMDPHPTMSFVAFLLAWVAMMAAMMFPAVTPVVRLYSRAAARRQAAPTAFFVAGYLVLWTLVGIPAYFAWRGVDEPLMTGSPWAGRVAGAVAVAAALYQLTPLKTVCLRHCRSPMSFFLRHGKRLDRPGGAFVAGARHGIFCVGCCWLLMALLFVAGVMNLLWIAILTLVVLIEKLLPRGEWAGRGIGVILIAWGAIILSSALGNGS